MVNLYGKRLIENNTIWNMRRQNISGSVLYGIQASSAVVRNNITSHYPAWHETLQAFSGSTPDMLRLCVQGWWASVGGTKASGISKLMMSEGANFPDLAAFYQREVIEPGNALIRGILQRGVDRGEFRRLDMNYAVYTVLAPMLFLVMWKHSFGRNMPSNAGFVPDDFLTQQIETLLHGLCVPAQDPPAAPDSILPSNSVSKKTRP